MSGNVTITIAEWLGDWGDRGEPIGSPRLPDLESMVIRHRSAPRPKTNQFKLSQRRYIDTWVLLFGTPAPTQDWIFIDWSMYARLHHVIESHESAKKKSHGSWFMWIDWWTYFAITSFRTPTIYVKGATSCGQLL